MRDSILIIQTQSPYGNSLPKLGLDMLLGATTVFNKVNVLFMDNGIYQLLKNQDPKFIEQKQFTAAYEALDYYDIDLIYVSQQSCLDRQIKSDHLFVNYKALANEEIQALIAGHNIILMF